MSKSPSPQLKKEINPFEKEELTHSKRVGGDRVAIATKEQSQDLLASTLKTSVTIKRKMPQTTAEQLKHVREHKQHQTERTETRTSSQQSVRLNTSLQDLRNQNQRSQESEGQYVPTILDRAVSFLAKLLKNLEKKILGKLSKKNRQNQTNQSTDNKTSLGKKKPGLLALLVRRQ